jgi:hypothetical protein
MTCEGEMNKFVVQPLKGLDWNGSFLPLGALRREVAALFGKQRAFRWATLGFGRAGYYTP